ncbi:MAG: dephospho-CoA kinase [Kiritimatiellae bacterium]|nr:dephospho-CoA kinase [Kiritimatiellia bacterium]MDD4736508.1 dephospho-CoA kinase [Kiritimatiellia bacterium]
MNNESERKHSPLRLAVTGGIGCGKSELGRILERHGVAVCDTDVLARDLVVPGGPVLKRLEAHFGAHILQADGSLRREVLAETVFNRKEELDFLNALMHPEIRRRVQDWLSEAHSESGMVAVIIPLLFETEDTAGWDAILCVSAPEGMVRERLVDRGYAQEQITARMQAQMALSRKEAASDYVIVNDGTRRELEQKTEDVLKAIQKEKVRYA